MARAEASVVINRPVQEVFAFATNPENQPEWKGRATIDTLFSSW